MNATVTLHVNEDTLKRIAHRTLSRFGGWRLGCSSVVVVVLFITNLAASPLSWWTFLFGGCILLILAIRIFVRISVARRARATVAKLGEYDVKFSITEEGLVYETPLKKGMIPWRMFVSLSRFPDFWLIHKTPILAEALPTDQLTPEVRDFIIAKVKENGGKVK